MSDQKSLSCQDQAVYEVLSYINNFSRGDHNPITLDQVFLMEFSEVIQNWRAWVSTALPDSHYYEVSYSGDTDLIDIAVYTEVDRITYSRPKEQEGA